MHSVTKRCYGIEPAIFKQSSGKGKGKVYPCTDTEALYVRPVGVVQV